MNSYLSISFFTSVTWTKVEVSDSACLGAIKTGPSLQFLKEWSQATQSALF